MMKETRKKKKFIQFSLKLRFQGQKNPQKYKKPNNVVPCRL